MGELSDHVSKMPLCTEEERDVVAKISVYATKKSQWRKQRLQMNFSENMYLFFFKFYKKMEF